MAQFKHFKQKLDQAGFDHILLGISVIVITAAIGSYMLVASHAATPTAIRGAQIKNVSDYCISTPVTRPSPGSRLVLEHCRNVAQQAWTVVSGNRLKITGLCLDLRGTKPGTGLRIDTCNNSAGQHWNMSKEGNIVNLSTRLCVTNDHGREKNGNAIQADTCVGSTSQQWSTTAFRSTASRGRPSSTPTPTPQPTSPSSLTSFFAPAFRGTPFCQFSKQNDSVSNGVLTISYPAGSSAPSAGMPYGGAQICIPSSTGPRTTLALTYKIRFPIGFQFVKGGKLPGLYGGTEPFSGGAHNANGWSMRLMWRTGGAGEVYSYTAHTSSYGDEYGKGNFFWQADGKWHTVTERATINTHGSSNGSVTLSYDGRQVINQTGIDVTNTNTLVGGLFFSTFYGGHDSSWAPTASETIGFSNFIVSR